MTLTTPPAWASTAVFDVEGHLEEPFLTALADGVPGLPEEAVRHLEGCDLCAGRLVEAADLSLRVGARLREALAPVPQGDAAIEAPPPWRTLAVVLALSLAGLAPSIARVPALVSQGAPALVHAGPLFARALVSFPVFLATLASSLLLIALGLVVSRTFRTEGVLS